MNASKKKKDAVYILYTLNIETRKSVFYVQLFAKTRHFYLKNYISTYASTLYLYKATGKIKASFCKQVQLSPMRLDYFVFLGIKNTKYVRHSNGNNCPEMKCDVHTCIRF